MVDQKQISKAVISRLPRYYRYLGELMEEGIERISSNELSARMKVTASQIRQDLNNFGGFGQQGYGYNVKYLYTEIARILGIDRQHNLIIIGAGNLGQAIANYTNFEKRGFIIKGMFDINPRLIGLVVRGVEIRGIEDLEQFIVERAGRRGCGKRSPVREPDAAVLPRMQHAGREGAEGAGKKDCENREKDGGQGVKDGNGDWLRPD